VERAVAPPAGRALDLLAVAVYAAMVAGPFAAALPMLSVLGMPVATALTAAVAWRWLAHGRTRVGPLRGAAIGALVGLACHGVFALGLSVWMVFTPSAQVGLGEALGTGLKMGLVMTIFGGIVSVPVGALAFAVYAGVIRPRLLAARDRSVA
jgi:hypothetical protein